MRTKYAWLMTGALLALAPGVGHAQENALSQLLSGTAAPTTMKLKQLGPEWRRVTLGGPVDTKGGSLGQMAGGLLGMMFGGGSPGSSAPAPYYTQGKTASINGEMFLITYRAQRKSLDMATLMKAQNPADLPAPERLTGESTITLELVNVHSIQTIGDIRSFNLQQELADSAKAAEDEADLIRQMQKGPFGAFGGGAPVAPEITAPDKPEPVKKPAPAKKAPAKK